MKLLAYPESLRRELILVIVIKILFLCAFWQVVLKPQARHADATAMAQKLISTPTPSQEH